MDGVLALAVVVVQEPDQALVVLELAGRARAAESGLAVAGPELAVEVPDPAEAELALAAVEAEQPAAVGRSLLESG